MSFNDYVHALLLDIYLGVALLGHQHMSTLVGTPRVFRSGRADLYQQSKKFLALPCCC